jgi:hypothetical protein
MLRRRARVRRSSTARSRRAALRALFSFYPWFAAARCLLNASPLFARPLINAPSSRRCSHRHLARKDHDECMVASAGVRKRLFLGHIIAGARSTSHKFSVRRREKRRVHDHEIRGRLIAYDTRSRQLRQ